MRHGVKFNALGRKKAHRKALMRNFTRQLVEHKRIVTTLAKAKALRVHVEPILTKCKKDTTHNRRVVFSYVQDKETIKEMFGVISQKIADRPGGYTRIIKLDQRRGDNADMAMIELVDFNDVYDTSTEVGTKKKRTRRTRKKKTTEAATAPAEAKEAPAVEETPAEAVVDAPEVVAEEAAPVVEETTEVVEEVAEAATEETPAEEAKEA
jgi:large subunit ribosomal protein L17